MTLTFAVEIILIFIYICSISWFVRTHLHTKKALQWWCKNQSKQLCQEAETIRDGLLQESFHIRRSLELSLANNSNVTIQTSQKYLDYIDAFYHNLVQLSDRLSPAYIEDNLPLAIQGLLKSQLAYEYNIDLKFEIPKLWQHESRERNQVILQILAELLYIIVPLVKTKAFINISMHSTEQANSLIVEFSYSDLDTDFVYAKLTELKYLKRVFTLLTSGKCIYRQHDTSLVGYFYWNHAKKSSIQS